MLERARSGCAHAFRPPLGECFARSTVGFAETDNLLIRRDLNPDFQFELRQTNLWMSIVIRIHAGLNAVRTSWRHIPNRRETKSAISALHRFPKIASDF